MGFQRERLATSDGDFLDLDWQQSDNTSLLLMIHGLEGHSRTPYMKSMARFALQNDWDICAMNLRGCSGAMNRLFSMYHSGKTEDLAEVLNHIHGLDQYTLINLIGFSLGGNIVLKYLGENRQIPSKIRAFATISTPFDLQATAYHLARPANFLYETHLIRSLKSKLKQKVKQFPDLLTKKTIRQIKDFESFDNLYTAPAHGFRDAFDYWQKCSAVNYLDTVQFPGIAINALDDPFIPKKAYPFEIAKNHPYFHLETPDFGGHVGFAQNFKPRTPLYHEERIFQFLGEVEDF